MSYVLIAESGSTKTDWRLGKNPQEFISFETIGLNPFYVSAREVQLILSSNFPAQVAKPLITKIFFYGAGCWYDEQIMVIEEGLKTQFPEADIQIFSDLLGASRALFGSSHGLTAILGTGASACYYDGQQITQQIKSLGFILGDEGSGAAMGKELLARYLRKDLSSRLRSDFALKYSYTQEQLLNAVYSEPFPNRFLARFSEFILENRESPEIHEIIFDNFSKFFDRYICRYEGYEKIPLGCVGSVAYHFEKEIRELAGMRKITVEHIKQSAIDDLVIYHLS
jgi:glucosamine kinase